MSDEKYYVVFVKTGEGRTTKGIRTIIEYENKDRFLKGYDEEMQRYEDVVAEGVTRDEAKRLAEETPFLARVDAAIEEGITKDGNIHPYVIASQLAAVEHLIPPKSTSEGLDRFLTLTERLRERLPLKERAETLVHFNRFRR